MYFKMSSKCCIEHTRIRLLIELSCLQEKGFEHQLVMQAKLGQ